MQTQARWQRCEALSSQALRVLTNDRSPALRAPALCQEVVQPFVLACASRQTALCNTGLATLQRILANGALSRASTAALETTLSQVGAMLWPVVLTDE